MLRKALSLKRFPYKSGCACSEKWGRPSTFALLFTRLGGHAPKSWTAAGLARAFFIRFYRFLGGYTPKKHWIFSRETGWSCSEFCSLMKTHIRVTIAVLDIDYLVTDNIYARPVAEELFVGRFCIILSMIEKIPPKGVSFSDLICIFAMSY